MRKTFERNYVLKFTKRLEKIPPYPFKKLDEMKAEAAGRGMDIISLGVGDPDLPTPQKIIDTLCKEAANPANHQYPSYEGMLVFRETAVEWMEKRFGVKLDPEKEIVSLIGSKEGIAHIYPAFVQLGDISLVPEPAYPVYHAATVMADGTPFVLPLKKRNGFLPDFDAIPKEALNKSRIMFLNYPNNPTAATASLEFFERAVAVAKEHDIVLCHDAAYSELTFDDYVAPSILQVDGAMDCAVEFHSLSKTFCMTGWRVGFAVGNKHIIEGLSKMKTNIDSGLFQAIQYAGITAMKDCEDETEQIRETFRERRDTLVAGLKSLGWKVETPKATFYLWVPVPTDESSLDFCSRSINDTGVIITPGIGFGREGEGFFRIAYTKTKEKLEEAVEKLGKLKI